MLIIYETGPEGIQPCNMKNRDIYWRRYKKRCIGQWCLSPFQSMHLWTSQSSPNRHQLPIVFSWISLMVWNLFPFKGDFSLAKSQKRSHRVTNLSCMETESPGWFDILPKNSPWDKVHEQVCCHDEAANHQLPIAAAFWIIPVISTKKCSSFMQNLMQIWWSTPSVILNVMATQYTCSLNSVYAPTD